MALKMARDFWVEEASKLGAFMALRINTNVASISAQRHLGRSEERTDHALKALASGQRIVRPADDAAGLAISENLRGQVRGLRQSKMNAENAISLIQVAEGGLNEQSNILIRLRELAIQAASDTVSDTERDFLNLEFDQLTQELDRIALTTTYGNKKLLEGSGEQFEFQLGAGGGEENVVSYSLNADSRAGTLGVDGMAIDDQDDARDNLDGIDEALQQIGAMRADFGAIQSRLSSAQSNLDIQYENLSEAKARISDADVAYETSELVQARVLQQMGTAVLAQA